MVERGLKPLAGIRVLDMSRVVSGPTCCFFLASLGAEVIRVESPGGDVTWVSAPFVGPDGAHRGPRRPEDIAVSALRKQRNKRSVVINLRDERGTELVRQLVPHVDVLVENFRPGVMHEMGLDYPSLQPINPRLVYASITGYGPDGPYRDRPSMDLAIQAASGLMAKTGFPDGPPTKIGATVGDQVPALFTAMGILAALRQRDRDGLGQCVDVAMFDSLLTILWDEPVDDYHAMGIPDRVGNSDPRGAPLDTYPTADGWMGMVCTTNAMWERLAPLIGRADLLERCPTHIERAIHRDEINAAVAAYCADVETDELVDRFLAIGVPVAAVRPPWYGTIDPHVAHRGALERLRHPELSEASEYWAPVLPIRMSRADVHETTPAERLGASTDAILHELVGITDQDLAALHDAGVIA